MIAEQIDDMTRPQVAVVQGLVPFMGADNPVSGAIDDDVDVKRSVRRVVTA